MGWLNSKRRLLPSGQFLPLAGSASITSPVSVSAGELFLLGESVPAVDTGINMTGMITK